MDHTFREIIKSKFASDSLFSLSSVFLLGIFGLLLNFVIAGAYDARTLGTFNLVYAVYIFSSQLATLGIQVSSLKHVAEFADDEKTCGTIIVTATLAVATLASLSSLLLYLLHEAIGTLFRSAEVATGILYVIPGLWFFSINKLFLNVLNGFRRMKAYALFVSFRYLAMITALITVVALKIPGAKLSSIFSVAEALLFIGLLIYCRDMLSLPQTQDFGMWMKRHLSFGSRSFMGGVTSELNTRVDVLILGYYWSEWHVGIYSFAAIIVEGFMQIPFILKQNMDPILTRLIIQKKHAQIPPMISKGRNWVLLVMAVLGGILILLYPNAVRLLVRNDDFYLGWPVFCILMAGAVVQAGYTPFSGILVQGGYPGLQTLLILAVACSNIVLNLLLVPFFGITGAAAATALSFILLIFFLKWLTLRALNIKI